jgi:IS30 family transposase
MQLSHETIYACIYAHPGGELKKLLVQSLRRSKSKCGPRGSKESNYSSLKIPEQQLIKQRRALPHLHSPGGSDRLGNILGSLEEDFSDPQPQEIFDIRAYRK